MAEPPFLVVRLTGKQQSSPLGQAKENSCLAKFLSIELPRVVDKIDKLKVLGGRPVLITGIGLYGEDEIDTVELTYCSGEGSFTKQYTKDDFYRL